MRAVSSVVSCVLAVAVASVTHAQANDRKGAPEKGTWGAEATAGGSLSQAVGQGGSLLRFVSPRIAFTGGASFSRFSTEDVSTIGEVTSVFKSAITTVALQAGLRRYGGTGLGLRPVVGGGLLVSRQSISGSNAGFSGSRSTGVGGYAEAGAAYFFNPHVSLGVLGGVSAVKNDGGWSTGGTLGRLTGAVYF